MDEVGEHLSGQGSTNGKSLCPQEKGLIFLFYLAGNSLLRIKKYAHDVAMGTIVNAIYKCIDTFFTVLVPKYITLPSPEQARRESELFHESSGFPKIIWAAIGKHYARLFKSYAIQLTKNWGYMGQGQDATLKFYIAYIKLNKLSNNRGYLG